MQYITLRVESATSPTEKDTLTAIKELYEKKLWHQLTEVRFDQISSARKPLAMKRFDALNRKLFESRSLTLFLPCVCLCRFSNSHSVSDVESQRCRRDCADFRLARALRQVPKDA